MRKLFIFYILINNLQFWFFLYIIHIDTSITPMENLNF